ncbi:MAG: hypothetical protein ACPG43_12550 [Alcanivoracaceae bacterium]
MSTHHAQLYTWHGEDAGVFTLPDSEGLPPGRWLIDPDGRTHLNLGYQQTVQAWWFQQTLDTPPTGAPQLTSEMCVHKPQETAA